MGAENQNSNKHRARTYARNRTKLSRRGFEKNPEKDTVFLSKLIICMLAGSFWLKFAAPAELGELILTGVPIGAIVGLVAASRLEKRSENRRIFYAMIVLCALISYFLPSGIVI